MSIKQILYKYTFNLLFYCFKRLNNRNGFDKSRCYTVKSLIKGIKRQTKVNNVSKQLMSNNLI